jgi:energy-coupling factor transporter ATP-binding protein EcfA2
MTLRGVGSYLYGERLDIRPMTVLCGKNGSGKSTWLKSLDLLKLSLPSLPFEFERAFLAQDDTYTNARIGKAENPGQRRTMIDSRDESRYGPLGTIGLHFEATSDLALPRLEPTTVADPIVVQHLAQHFLCSGQCPKGTHLRLRFAHPLKWWDDDSGEELYDFVELTIDNVPLIEFKRRVFYGGSTGLLNLGEGARNAPYSVRWSPPFLSLLGCDRDGSIAEVMPHPNGYDIEVTSSLINSDILRACCDLAIKRIRELAGLLLNGYFHIDAVRALRSQRDGHQDPEDAVFVKDVAAREQLIDQRYVGRHGEGTMTLLQSFAYNQMRQPDEPYSGHIDQAFPKGSPAFFSQVGAHLLQASQDPHRTSLKRISEAAEPEILRQVVEGECQRQSGDYDKSLILTWSELLNDVLSRPDLYEKDLWPLLDDEEARSLIDRGIQRLSDDEIRRLNRLLIEAAFGRMAGVPHRTGYLFETFVAVWLERLLQIQIGQFRDDHAGVTLADDWSPGAPAPVGYLVHDRPKWLPVGPDWHRQDRLTSPPFDQAARFLNDCLGNISPSRDLAATDTFLSSGFQQVAPLVVQAGLMKQYEMMAIENPEVHLHPSLQLDVAEFLLTQASTGKTILIETHSDLVVRRIMRAILQEEIAQSEVGIYFASLERNPEARAAWSRLGALQTNERGQISNWPPGFMDDDVKESQRIMDIMYGAPPDETHR